MSWLKDKLKKQWAKTTTGHASFPMRVYAAAFDFAAARLCSDAIAHRFIVGAEDRAVDTNEFIWTPLSELLQISEEWAASGEANDDRWKEQTGDPLNLVIRRALELASAELDVIARHDKRRPTLQMQQLHRACLYYGHTKTGK